ncbi:MAG TPA: hypothetical protein VGM03_02220 [Phycisphaerae bacterium]|jgi:hypothetical protein
MVIVLVFDASWFSPAPTPLLSASHRTGVDNVERPIRIDYIDYLDKSPTGAVPLNPILVIADVTNRAAANEHFGLGRSHTVTGGVVQVPFIPAERHR